MQANDSQQIVALLSKVVKKRKLIVFFTIMGLLIPILVYNYIAKPTYQATTSLIFDGFVSQVTNVYNYDVSREIVVQNRLEEIKSLAFSEDMVRALPLDIYTNFKVPEDAPPDFDRAAYISEKINRSISAVAIRGSAVLQISIEMSNPALCRDLANIAVQVFQDRIYKVRQQGVTGVRSFLEEQLTRIQSQLADTEEQLKDYKQKNHIISVDRASQGLLRKMTEAEVLYNSVKSSRGSVEKRLSTIQDKLKEQKRDLVPSITDIASPYIQKLKTKLISLEEQYTDLKLQGYGDDHSQMVQMKSEIATTKHNLTNEAIKIANGDNVIDPLAQIEKYVNESYSLQVELETYRAQELTLKKTIDGYEANLATLPEKEFVLARLIRQKEVMDTNYHMLKQKYEESKIAEAEKMASVRILDLARLPVEPISPRKKINIALGLILGFLVGLGIAFIAEVNNTALDSSEELERVTGWPVLASVPMNEKMTTGRFSLMNRQAAGNGKSPMIKRSMITGLEGKTGIAETYRMLRTNLQFLGIGDKYKTILATSIGPDEGKSTTLTNLAITLAKMDQRVLLVDSDLRRPQMHAVFDLDKEPGLSDLLVYHNAMKEDYSAIGNGQSFIDGDFKQQEMGDLVDNFSDFVMDGNFISKINNLAGTSNLNILNSSLVEAVQSTHIENLKVLTSGRQLKNPSETIASISMKSLLEELKNKFDVILIDSAPLLLVPESMVISSLVDGVIFVVDSQKYNQEMLLKAKGLLQKANANVIGTVLNRVEVTAKDKDNYYYYNA